MLTGVWPHRLLHVFNEHALAYHTKLSNSFAQLDAAVSLQPVCMVGVVAERHQSVSR